MIFLSGLFHTFPSSLTPPPETDIKASFQGMLSATYNLHRFVLS